MKFQPSRTSRLAEFGRKTGAELRPGLAEIAHVERYETAARGMHLLAREQLGQEQQVRDRPAVRTKVPNANGAALADGRQMISHGAERDRRHRFGLVPE